MLNCSLCLLHYKLVKKTNRLKENEVKFYPQPVKLGVKGTKDLTKEIAGRCSLTRGDVLNVLSNLSEVINKWLVAGYHVKLDNLGTLRLTFRSEGSATAEECDASLVKYVRVRLLGDMDLREELQKNVTFEKVSKIKV
ncbi:MAG TPA: DNA-binding protein [Prevotellaceae bacterium]|nr:DNA-binding protein [Prevotellaceae bacterium]